MTTRDLTDLMHEATDDLPEVDLADVAWQRARRGRTTRVMSYAAAAGLAAATVVGVVALGGSPPAPAPTPATRTTTTSAPPISPALATVSVKGASIDLAPDPDAMARLPRLQPAELGLPEQPGFDASTRIPPLDGPVNARVTMVLLRVVEPQRSWRPVLYVVDAAGTGRYLEVPVTLGSAYDAHDNAAAPLGPRAVSQDGRRVAFAQPSEAVVVDVADAGTVRRFPVPAGLTRSGWDGETVVLRSDTSEVRLDPATGKHRTTHLPPPVSSPSNERSAIEGQVGVAPYGRAGEQEADAVWLAQGALDDGRYQGVAVMTRPRRVLAASPDRRVPKIGLRPLAWAGPGVLLVSADSYVGTLRSQRILLWDVGGSTLQQVATLVPATETAGGFSGDLALGPVQPQ